MGRQAPGPGAPTRGCRLVAEEGSRESVDAGCRNLTAPWVRDKAQSDPSVELCGYFEDLENAGPEVISGFTWDPPTIWPPSSGLEPGSCSTVRRVMWHRLALLVL